MSLVRLLEIGRSLNAIRETQSRYRMHRQNLLPKFGMAGSAAWCPPTTAAEPTEPAASGLRLRSITNALQGPIGGEQKQSKWAKLGRACLNFLDRTGDFVGKTFKPLNKWAARPGDDKFALRRSTAPSVVSLQKPVATPIQTELSLDKVKVVRNDLSDADLEVVPMAAAGASLQNRPPALATALHRQMNGSWGRFTARLFQVPVGYQDETGFHFGAKAAEKEAAWPPFW